MRGGNFKGDNVMHGRFDFNAKKNILDFQSLIPFFMILVVGFLAALLALLGENFFAKMNKKKKKFDILQVRPQTAHF